MAPLPSEQRSASLPWRLSASVANFGGKPLNQHVHHTAEAPHETKGKEMRRWEVEWHQAHLENQSVLSARRDEQHVWLNLLRSESLTDQWEGSARGDSVKVLRLFLASCATLYRAIKCCEAPLDLLHHCLTFLCLKHYVFMCDIGNNFCLEFAHFPPLEMSTPEAWWPKVADCVAFSHKL